MQQVGHLNGVKKMTRYTFSISLRAVGLTLVMVVALITVIAAQYAWLGRLTDRVERLQRDNHVLLCRADSGRGIYAYFDGKHVYFDKAGEFVDREHRRRIVVENDGKKLRVELDGVMIACQTLRVDLGSGQWAKDEMDFYERIGVDFDFAAVSETGAQ